MQSKPPVPSSKRVRQMFTSIAERYDTANRVLSGGADIAWRRRLVREVCACRPQSVADLATGSGDVALALGRSLGSEATIIGLDFCDAMLDNARRKQPRNPIGAKVIFRLGDCCKLPFESRTLDVVSIAFGLRNLEDRDQGLYEMRRVLRPGGVLLILEFSQPFRWMRPFYAFYLKVLLPHLGALVTGNRDAYAYLSGSIESFPDRGVLAAQIRAAGFSTVEAFPLSLGIVALHRAVA